MCTGMYFTFSCSDGFFPPFCFSHAFLQLAHGRWGRLPKQKKHQHFAIMKVTSENKK